MAKALSVVLRKPVLSVVDEGMPCRRAVVREVIIVTSANLGMASTATTCPPIQSGSTE